MVTFLSNFLLVSIFEEILLEKPLLQRNFSLRLALHEEKMISFELSRLIYTQHEQYGYILMSFFVLVSFYNTTVS